MRTGAEQFEVRFDSSAQAEAFDRGSSNRQGVPVSAHVSLKLAIGRMRLRELVEPIHVSVVFAVYKEHQRLRRSAEDPLGEDALREKLRQLRWLFADTPQHSWDLAVVDDGCPEGSGALAESILADFALPEEECRVLYLADAIEAGLPTARGLESTDQSRKGGAVRLGMWDAVQTDRGPGHIVVFTDADLSTHLGQIGLLVHPIAAGARKAALGSRREPTSVVVKSGTRDSRGRLFIYLWKRMLPELDGVVDTQCGFKAFDAGHLRTWIEDTRDAGFSFDIEALVRIRKDGPGLITRVPIAWIDSEAASTTVEFQPYLSMLKNIAELHHRIDAPPAGAPFARLVESLDEKSFQVMVDRVPDEIASRQPKEFDRYDGVSAGRLAEAAGLRI